MPVFFIMNRKLIHIAIPKTINRYFTYSVTSELAGKLKPGHRCLVPFGKKTIVGYFIKFTDEKPKFKIKPVSDILEPDSLFNKELYGFLKWMSQYYFCNIADVLSAALPPKLRGKTRVPKLDSDILDKGVLLGYSQNSEKSISELDAIYKDKDCLTRQELLLADVSSYKFTKYKNDEYILPVYGLPRYFDYVQPRQGIKCWYLVNSHRC